MPIKRNTGRKKKMTVTLAKKCDMVTDNNNKTLPVVETTKQIVIRKKNGSQQQLQSVSYGGKSNAQQLVRRADFVSIPRFAPQSGCMSDLNKNVSTEDEIPTFEITNDPMTNDDDDANNIAHDDDNNVNVNHDAGDNDDDDDDVNLNNGLDEPRHHRVVVASGNHLKIRKEVETNNHLDDQESVASVKTNLRSNHSHKKQRMQSPQRSLHKVVRAKKLVSSPLPSSSIPMELSDLVQTPSTTIIQLNQEFDDNEDDLHISEDESQESSVLFECLKKSKDHSSKPPTDSPRNKNKQHKTTTASSTSMTTSTTSSSSSSSTSSSSDSDILTFPSANIHFKTVFSDVTKNSHVSPPEAKEILYSVSRSPKLDSLDSIVWTLVIIDIPLSQEKTIQVKDMLQVDFGFDVFDYSETILMFRESGKTLLTTGDYKSADILDELTSGLENLFSRYVLLVKYWLWFKHLKTTTKSSSSLSSSSSSIIKRRLAIINPTIRAKASVAALQRRGAYVISSCSSQAIREVLNPRTTDKQVDRFHHNHIPRYTVWRANNKSDIDESTRVDMVTNQASLLALEESVAPRFGWSPIDKKRVIVLLGNFSDAQTIAKCGYSVYNDFHIYQSIATTLLSVVCASGDSCETAVAEENNDNQEKSDMLGMNPISIAALKHRFARKVRQTCHRVLKTHFVIRRFRKWCDNPSSQQIVICGLDPVYHAPDIRLLKSHGAYVVAKQHSLPDISVDVDEIYHDPADLELLAKRHTWNGKQFSFTNKVS